MKALVVLTAALALAQPTFRASTTLVEFTLVALDADGNPVTNLDQKDIVVLEGGEARDIAFFRFDGTAGRRETERLDPGVFTNRSEYSDGPARNVTAIVIDGIFTPPSQQQMVRTQVLRYLDAIASDTRVALYHSGYRLTLMHDYTSDLASLRARMATLLSSPAVYVQNFDTDAEESAEPPDLRSRAIAEMKRLDEQYQESVEDRKRRIALASLDVVGNHLAGVTGRKSLVWITMGFPIYASFDRYLTIHDAETRRMAERLANLGVSIYPVDAQGLAPPPVLVDQPLRGARGQRGLTATAPPPPPRPTSGLPDQRNWATMDLVAGVTGGRVVRNTNDVSRGLRAADVDQRGSYSIAFYAPASNTGTTAEWRRFEVRSQRRGVHLSHRQGYLSEPAPRNPSADWSKEQWRWAINNPVGSTVLNVDARMDVTVNAQGETYGLLLLLGAEQLQFRPVGDKQVADAEIAIAEKTSKGDFSYRLRTSTFTLPPATMPAGTVLRYTDRWQLRPGTATIRVIVRDRTSGRYGTLDVPAKLVPSTRVKGR
jgi:VWFA-related protein